MSRLPRPDVPGMPQHLVVRGNNRTDCFFDDQDRHIYLRYLQEYSVEYACDVHAYVLMTNHVHLLATGREPRAISRFMQVLNRRYARFVNRAHKRTGTLYEGRFLSGLVETDRSFFAVMRYIELNAVRARMVIAPDEYRWSSFRQNVSGVPGGLLTPHPLYLQLGSDAVSRSRGYLKTFEEALDEKTLAGIRENLK